MIRCLSRRKVPLNHVLQRAKTTDTSRVPSRAAILSGLMDGEEFDVLIIGAGATGSGAALDAAQRGLRVACIEREDFSSGTSSRSTKLLWGGSRYLVQAFVSLLSTKLFTSPVETVERFKEDFHMVMNCHRERRFMLQEQPHLTKWLPIAVPFDKWFLVPPPFGFFPAIFGPLGLFPAFFKFYDALSGFSCPPSHIMTPKRARRKFPQLANGEIKYCSIFYEGTHDDARTNLAVAQTAAAHGALIANYCEARALLRADGAPTGKVVGATVCDVMTGKEFDIRAKSVLLCGGPFTDELRALEDPTCKRAIEGASGIHIVLPAYFAPENIGLVDMNTSDGRFMFFLPWKSHVLVGTTDHQSKPTMRPIPDESEIKWLLHEASKYLNPELRLRRQDVLSAWSGIRPLARDPHATSTATASRDHVISHNPASGIVFISGGKWTTFREMAEDAVDKVIEVTPELQSQRFSRCRTLETHFVGYDGYSENLQARLIQQYNVTSRVARRLARAYGGRAVDVIKIAKEIAEEKKARQEKNGKDRGGGVVEEDTTATEQFVFDLELGDVVSEGYAGPEALLVPDYPFIEAEVVFGVRHDWVMRPEDFLARRTRLAFLNKDAALRAIPRVVQLMARELKWNRARQSAEIQRCVEFMRHFGGSKPVLKGPSVRLATRADLREVFRKAKPQHAQGLTRDTLQLASEMLNHVLTQEELEDCLQYAESIPYSDHMSASTGAGAGAAATSTSVYPHAPPAFAGVISFEAFEGWWNSERLNPGLVELKASKSANVSQIQGSGALFG